MSAVYICYDIVSFSSSAFAEDVAKHPTLAHFACILIAFPLNDEFHRLVM